MLCDTGFVSHGSDGTPFYLSKRCRTHPPTAAKSLLIPKLPPVKLPSPPRFQSHIITAFSSWLLAFLLVTTMMHTREGFRLVARTYMHAACHTLHRNTHAGVFG